MSEDNSIQPQEDKLISQAKKRLLGACVLLFILLISGPFVLKNRNEEGPTEPIKISMESSPVIADMNAESIKPADIKPDIQESPSPQNKKELSPSSPDAVPSTPEPGTTLGWFSGTNEDACRCSSAQTKTALSE